jgi:hypothetical protein
MVEKIYNELFTQGRVTVPFEVFAQHFNNNASYRAKILRTMPELALPREPKYKQEQKQESQEEKFLVDNIPFIGDFIGDIGRAWKGGLQASESVDESIELMKGLFGDGASDEEILKFIDAYNKSTTAPTSDEMMSFNKIYEEEGKGVWGFLKGTANNPTIIPQLFVSSMATMIGSAVDSDDVAKLAAGGAAAGSFAGPTGLFAGGVGALATGMEAALTFGELLKEEVGEDNFNLETIKSVFEDPNKVDSLLQKSVARGIAIGAFEALAGSLAGKAVKASMLRGGSKLSATTKGIGIEAVGGSSGEVAGRLAAGQEMDVAEIGFEGVAGTATAPISIGLNIAQPGTYKINNQSYSVNEFVENLNLLDPTALRAANIEVQNNDIVEKLVNDKRQEALYDLAIGQEVTNLKDRREIVKLEKQHAEIKDQTSVTGNIKATEIKNKIKNILKKYDGSTTASDVISSGAYLRKTQNLENNLAKTEAFAKFLKIGFKSLSNEEYVNFFNEYNAKHKTNFDSDGEGRIIQDADTGKQVIVINKDEAMRSDQFTVGQHELLHGLLHETLKNNDETAITLGKELENYLNKINVKEINNSRFKERLQAYKDAVKDGKLTEAERYEEVLTLTSEAMANNELKYDQTTFDKLADLVRQFLRKHFNVNMELNTAEDVFNLLKDYNKSFEEGKLYKSFGRLSTNALQGRLISEPSLQTAKKIYDKKKISNYDIENKQRKEIVNRLYDQLGNEAIDQVIPYYMPKVEAVVNQRRDYSTSDLSAVDIAEEKSDIIMDTMYNLLLHARAFNPTKNDDFDAYINSYIVQKFGTAVKRIQRKETKVTETQERKARQKGTLDTITEQATTSISDKIKIDPKVQSKLNTIVKQQVTDVLKKLALGTKPRIAKLNLQDTFRQAIRKDLKNTIKKKEVYAKFLKDNFETYFNDVNVETLNKRFRGDRSNPDLFVKPTGKRVTKTATSQPQVFEKQPFSEVKKGLDDYFLNVSPQNVSNRKDKIVEEISNYMAFEIAQQVTSSPEIFNVLNETGIQEVIDINADKLINDARNVTNVRSKLKISLPTYEAYGRPALTEFFLSANSDPLTFELFLEDIIADVPANERKDFVQWITDMKSQIVPLDKDAWARKQEEYLRLKDKDVYDLYTLDVGGKNSKKVLPENYGKARKQFAHGVKALIKNMHSDVLSVIAQLSDSAQLDFFGFNAGNLSKDVKTNKGLNNSDKDAKEILKAIQTGIKNNKNKPELGIKVEDIKQSLNVATGTLYKKIWKILKSTDTNKKEQLQALKPEIEKANAVNKKLFAYINLRLGELNASQNPMDRVGVLRIYKGTQNATNGFHRMFANFRHMEVYEGVSQDPKSESHPLYKEAKVLSDEFNKRNAKAIANGDKKAKLPAAYLKEYTEHLKENVFMLDETYGLARKNREKTIDPYEYNRQLEAVADDYDSSLNSHITTLDMDRSKFKDRKKVDAKTMGLGDKKMYYINSGRMNNMYDVLADKPSAESLADRVALENANEELRVGSAQRAPAKMSLPDQNKKFKNYDKALEMANRLNPPEKGISILDFDDTLAKTKSKVLYTLPDGTKGKIDATAFATESAALEAAGAKFDFSEFSKVKAGKKGPFFGKALDLIGKYGNKDMFILTARPADAAPAIQKFLKAVGLNIKLENIIGLEDGRPEAKAEFIVDKAAEGYNNFLFADDAVKNVDAVSEVLDSLDINGKVYKVKQDFRQDMDKKFNKILEQVKGIDRNAVFSDAAARVRGALNDKFWSRLFVPPGADDFKGLMYYFMGKGKQGEAHAEFFNETLFKPFAKATKDINAARQRIVNEYSQLTKDMPAVKKILLTATGYSNFTYDQAIRVYLMNQNNIEIPGISKRDLDALLDIVKSDPSLVAYADKVSAITQLDEGYVQPDDVNWLASTIELDLRSITTITKRAEYLTEWKTNRDAIFTPDNLNKIEAIYGASVRSALEDSLYRMEIGTNRPTGMSKVANEFTDWANGAVGNIMFFNIRSAVLQTISFANFVNWSDNNPYKYMKAVGNFPQFAKDFAMIWNSDFLKSRRQGLQTDVNASEIVNQAANSKNKVKAIIAYILGKGYLPTQMGDSFAICMGGAGFYRNRVDTYLKQGLSLKEAESKAFSDMQETSEDAQQSARPDKISAQQASEIGRWILSFQNTPMQYTRIIKKAALDLANKRGDSKTNISKIIYYGALQNLIFTSLQNAIFALAFSDEDDDKEKERYSRIANGMVDTILRGTGIYGAVAAMLKNVALEFVDQTKKGHRQDHAYTLIEAVNLSPALGSKARKVYSATQAVKFNSDEIMSRGFHIDNPAYEAVANVTSAAINLPVDRALRITDNMREATNQENQAWQRIALVLGWSTWDLGIEGQRRKKDKKKKGGVKLF